MKPAISIFRSAFLVACLSALFFLPQASAEELQIRARTSAQPRQPLAWRVRALKITSPSATARGAGEQKRLFAASFPDVLLTLLKAGCHDGFAIEALNTDAGEVLISHKQAPVRMVFCLRETENGQTQVTAASERATPSNRISDLFDSMQRCGMQMLPQDNDDDAAKAVAQARQKVQR